MAITDYQKKAIYRLADVVGIPVQHTDGKLEGYGEVSISFPCGMAYDKVDVEIKNSISSDLAVGAWFDIESEFGFCLVDDKSYGRMVMYYLDTFQDLPESFFGFTWSRFDFYSEIEPYLVGLYVWSDTSKEWLDYNSDIMTIKEYLSIRNDRLTSSSNAAVKKIGMNFLLDEI